MASKTALMPLTQNRKTAMSKNSISAIAYSTPTMSSREIAELTGKRHDHVVRDIEKMLNDIGEGLPKFGGTYINEQNGQKYRCYNLPKNLTLNLVTGYRTDMRLKIIDRWLELEGDPENHATPKLKRIRKPAFDTAFARCMNVVALLPNVDENQKVLMAARGTHTLTGSTRLRSWAMPRSRPPRRTTTRHQRSLVSRSTFRPGALIRYSWMRGCRSTPPDRPRAAIGA